MWDLNFSAQGRELLEWTRANGVRVFAICLIALILVKLSGVLARRALNAALRPKDDAELRKRADTLASMIRLALVATISSVAIMMILKEFGVEIAPILAGAGVVGLAVGFGAQNLVQDVITGFFILMEDQLRVGDVVSTAGKSGLVERITLRLVILRDLAGNVHYIRNGQIDVVTNMTRDFSRYVFEIGVAYREDFDEVTAAIKEVDEDLRRDPAFKNDILSPLEVLGLDQFADSAVIIKARTTTKPMQQWRVGREFNRRLKKKFDERGIEIPFPHVTLYMGQDKDASAPALRVSMDRSPGTPQ